jgi:hypothetical protein
VPVEKLSNIDNTIDVESAIKLWAELKIAPEEQSEYLQY